MTTDLTGRHPATVALLRHFDYGHLPPKLAEVSKLVHDLAHRAVELCDDDPELSVALRKFLEGKDALVRARKATLDKAAKPEEPKPAKDEGSGWERGGSLACSERASTFRLTNPDTGAGIGPYFGFGRRGNY